MRVLGVDPSSSTTGFSLLAEGELHWLSTWSSPEKANITQGLTSFREHLDQLGSLLRPDVVAVERLSVSWNLNTVRRICYVEGLALHWAAVSGCKIVHVNVSKARAGVFPGRGKLSKEQVYKIVTAEVEWLWSGYKDGGGDQVDAYVLARYAHGV